MNTLWKVIHKTKLLPIIKLLVITVKIPLIVEDFISSSHNSKNIDANCYLSLLLSQSIYFCAHSFHLTWEELAGIQGKSHHAVALCKFIIFSLKYFPWIMLLVWLPCILYMPECLSLISEEKSFAKERETATCLSHKWWIAVALLFWGSLLTLIKQGAIILFFRD